jgi:hypothetical protein
MGGTRTVAAGRGRSRRPQMAAASRRWPVFREKHVSPIDAPYSSKKRSELAFLDALASYDANVLGLAHRRQAQAAPYRAIAEKDADAFHDATEPVAKAYLELAREEFHSK